MTKKIVFFCFLISFLVSCQTVNSVQSGQPQRIDKEDYLIEVRSINPSPIISQVTMFLGNRATINLLEHDNPNYGFTGQHFVQIVCTDVTNNDLQNVLALISKCQGILEVIHHRM